MEWSGGCGEEKKCDIIAAINFLNIPTTNGSNEKKKTRVESSRLPVFYFPKGKYLQFYFLGEVCVCGGGKGRGGEGVMVKNRFEEKK